MRHCRLDKGLQRPSTGKRTIVDPRPNPPSRTSESQNDSDNMVFE